MLEILTVNFLQMNYRHCKMESFAFGFSNTKISSVWKKISRDWLNFLTIAFQKVLGQVWLVFVLCTRCIGCAGIFFTLRCRLPHRPISADQIKERLIVVYCSGE